MEIKIFLNYEEFTDDWNCLQSHKDRINFTTAKYIQLLNQIDYPAKVSIYIDIDNISLLSDNDLKFFVQAESEEIESNIYSEIARLSFKTNHANL